MRAIEATDLGRAYGERVALAGVTLTLEEGETLAVFGSNGAGKTTFLRILATLLRPHRGSVSVLGHALPREGYAVRSKIGFLGHEPLLYRDLTARENLKFHARLHGVPPARVEELLEAVGMLARADDPVHTFSRGMVQRTAVARAVLHRPSLLLLDEPFNGLDPGATALLTPLLAETTRVVISHDPSFRGDLVLGLRGGKTVFCERGASIDDVRALYA
jgi:heme exporter protein A